MIAFGARGTVIALMFALVTVLHPAAAEEPPATIVVGIYENPPLLFTEEDGTGGGLFAELLEHIARKEGWRIDYLSGTWEQSLSALETGKIDVLPAIAYSNARARRFTFTSETVFSNWGQVYARPEMDVRSLLHLDNRRIAAVVDDIHYGADEGLKDLLERLSVFHELLRVDTYAEVLEAVDSGRADAGVVNRLTGHLIGGEYKNASPTPVVFNPIEMHYAISPLTPGAEMLATTVDEHVARLQKDPGSIYHELIARTVSDYESGVGVPRWLLYTLVGLLVSLLFAGAVIMLFRTELRKRTKTLRDNRENLRITLASIGDGVISTDTEGIISAMNPVAESLTGWTSAQAHSRPLTAVFPIHASDAETSIEAVLSRVIATGEVERITDSARIGREEADAYRIDISLAPIRTDTGGTRGAVVVFRDVSERYAREAALRRSRRQYANLYSSIRDTIVVADSDRVILDANQPALRDMFGYELEDVVGRKTAFLYADREGFKTAGAAVFDKDGVAVGTMMEVVFRRKNGETFDAELSALKLVNEHGEVEGNLGIIRDITQRKSAERDVRKELAEKEVLLKEVHHRVKNNMNVVTSLLRLQKDAITSLRDADDAFDQAVHRVHSIALVHEMLYQSDNLARVRMDVYIQSLIHQLRAAFSSARPIEYVTECDDTELDVTTAIPCGIILNELITNAQKYAFEDSHGGTVTIRMESVPEQMVELTVQDDGRGLPADVAVESASSLGLNLVRMLTEQMNGELSVTAENGTSARLRFPRT